MNNFLLTAKVTISVYTEVEAETLKEAMRIAEERDLMPVIHSGGQTAEDTWMCDELDGVPEYIEEA
jgi:hypothetical protein